MRAAELQGPYLLVIIDKGSYETLTYFLNRTMAELWQRKHGGRLYERELEPPYWRAAKPEAPGGGRQPPLRHGRDEASESLINPGLS